jgi:hypothetical protein
MLEVALDLKFPKLMRGVAKASSTSNVDFMGLAPVGCVGWGMNHDTKLLLYTGVLAGLGVLTTLFKDFGDTVKV